MASNTYFLTGSSALNRIKASPPSPSALGMRRLLGRLELIEATGATTVEIG